MRSLLEKRFSQNFLKIITTFEQIWRKFFCKIAKNFGSIMKKVLWGGTLKAPISSSYLASLFAPIFHEHSHKVFGILLYAISESCDTDFAGQGTYSWKMLWKCYYSMSVINISCYEELSMLLELVFLKCVRLWQNLCFCISPLKR